MDLDVMFIKWPGQLEYGSLGQCSKSFVLQTPLPFIDLDANKAINVSLKSNNQLQSVFMAMQMSNRNFIPPT